MNLEPNRVIICSKAVIALHNKHHRPSVYCPPGFIDIEDGAGNSIDGRWRWEKSPVQG